MFDLPNAKRIRRDEIHSPTSSRTPSPAPDDAAAQAAYARLGKLLNLDQLDTAPEPTSQDNDPSAENEDEEQEFEFRLFSAPAKSTEQAKEKSENDTNANDAESKPAAATQKLRIRLHSPTPGSGDSTEGRFVKASRGWDYYFSTPSLQGTSRGEPTAEESSQIAEKKKQFEDMAVSGQHMMTWAQSLVWPGCHLPWRVIHLKRHQTKTPPCTQQSSCKKRRVQLRKRTAAAEAAKVSEAEKRTRKNRERKLKRRQKAREQKAAAAGVSVEDLPADADEGASSGGEE
ncbi:hypothetical protein N7457_007978 [Penicillium paradoxum]|uniref:uncharacterized protein n=1 Tax=Penicillium paradoxum TaxID=176176 RepID=UPI002549A762|nr:uncharacterized protein N7457_007978 [Penicillium paradoxum]KAJ5773082.1 hypothetical protein N7457_007978 [Penicillium paradoxum]